MGDWAELEEHWYYMSLLRENEMTCEDKNAKSDGKRKRVLPSCKGKTSDEASSPKRRD